MELIRISNPELDIACTNGFKGVFLMVENGSHNITFQHELGGVNCKPTTQKIINTILMLRLSGKQKVILLNNVEFMISEVRRIAREIHEMEVLNNSLNQIIGIISFVEQVTGLKPEDTVSLVVETMRIQEEENPFYFL